MMYETSMAFGTGAAPKANGSGIPVKGALTFSFVLCAVTLKILLSKINKVFFSPVFSAKEKNNHLTLF